MAAQFRCVDAAIIRLAVFGSALNLPPWPDLTGDTPEHVRTWRSWLARVWEQDAVVEAIEVASPVLARRVGDVCGGRVQQPRRVRRVVESVIRYLLRMTSRATPFGLFAGVAALRIGSTASIRWGQQHRAVTRPDAAWLAAVITQLEARPDVLRRLPVVANNLGFVRGERLVVPCPQRAGVAGGVRPAEVSVRHTRAVAAVIQAARSPITLGDLIGKLAAEFPGKPPARIEAMLTNLVCCRVLVTSLHPPMDVTDPLGHVINQLTATDTDAAPLSMVPKLRAISVQLSRHDQASAPEARRALRASVSRQMSAICDRPGPSLAVDLRVDCSVVLPHAVAREAEAAASALVRLTPHRFGNPSWQAWHARFRIPDVVHLGESDVRIRLDLNEPAHLALLRIHLDRTGKATATEAPDPHDHGWNGGHAHEIVIPLTATRPPPAPLSTRRAGPIRATHHPGHAPGSSRWLYARLYSHPDRQTDILTTHLPDLLWAWEDGPADDWWFLRYRDPEPHLRLRIRLHDADSYGSAPSTSALGRRA